MREEASIIVETQDWFKDMNIGWPDKKRRWGKVNMGHKRHWANGEDSRPQAQ